LAYLPGNEGGRAISNIIFGISNPCGKLPYTYPRYSGSIWTYDHQLSDERDIYFSLNGFTPQYEFGCGLSYTSFEYGNIILNSDSIKAGDKIEVSVDITNTGKTEGKEAVLLYISDEVATISPAVKQLKRFTKINLKPGETRKVSFELTSNDLMFVNRENNWIYEPGYFTVAIGNKKARFYVYN
jgi:beta-glucosidase